VTLGPNPIHLSRSQTANFYITTGADQVTSTRIKIYTIAGELVQQIGSQPGTAPDLVPWDLSQRNYASGTYLAVVELHTASGVIGRKVLKVVVVR
jgi:hypothetical protein